MSKVYVHKSCSQNTFFSVFLKCTIVSDIYEHVLDHSKEKKKKKGKKRLPNCKATTKWKEIKLYTVRVTPLICVCILLITSWKEQRIYS